MSRRARIDVRKQFGVIWAGSCGALRPGCCCQLLDARFTENIFFAGAAREHRRCECV